jgi:hypothetical protein
VFGKPDGPSKAPLRFDGCSNPLPLPRCAGTARRAPLSQESVPSRSGTPGGGLGKMRLYEEQLIPVGVAKPKHRRLGFRLFDCTDADLDG